MGGKIIDQTGLPQTTGITGISITGFQPVSWVQPGVSTQGGEDDQLELEFRMESIIH